MRTADDIAYTHIPHFLNPTEADETFQLLREQISWQTESYRLFGKQVLAPRLMAWYGDADAHYCYSHVEHHPVPWTPLLLALKKRVELGTGERYNALLLNCYRNGQDSMGWHSDDEPELGAEPVIASLSLGGSRKFVFRHRTVKEKFALWLNSGSLLVMTGKTQAHWQHSLPKTRRPVQARINLTFRLIK